MKKKNDTFPDLRIHIVDIDPIVGQYRDVINQVSVDHPKLMIFKKIYVPDEAAVLEKGKRGLPSRRSAKESV